MKSDFVLLPLHQGLQPGGVVVDMTTSEPALAEEIAEAAAAKVRC